MRVPGPVFQLHEHGFPFAPGSAQPPAPIHPDTVQRRTREGRPSASFAELGSRPKEAPPPPPGAGRWVPGDRAKAELSPCRAQPPTLARPGASHGPGGGAVTSSPSAHRAPRGRGHGGQSGNCLTWCGSRPASLLGRQGCVGKRGRPWEESMRRHTHAHADTRRHTHTHMQRPKRKPLCPASFGGRGLEGVRGAGRDRKP